MQTSWTNQPTSTRIIPREQHAAIFSVINLYRGWLKWQMQTAKDLDMEIKIWAEAFDEYRIPIDQYLPLLKRARDLRVSRLNSGLECPDYNSELLIACWIGESGLKKEIELNRVAKGRTLTANSETICPRCFGAGMEFRFDPETGFKIGIVGKCDHREIMPEDVWLWSQKEDV
jgi:hypothetical protein